jgi:transcriptional regulator with XRE-family HTH domain
VSRIEITEYDQIPRILRSRRMQLGLTLEAIDDLTGLQSGYTSKVERGVLRGRPLKGKNGKILGFLSFPLLFKVLGLRMIVETKEPHRRAG